MECNYLCKENYKFLPLDEDPSSVQIMFPALQEGGLTLSKHTCMKCSEWITFQIEDGCTVTEKGVIPTALVENTNNVCHPQFEKTWNTFSWPPYKETCVNCKCKPGAPGCLQVGEMYNEVMRVEHKTRTPLQRLPL